MATERHTATLGGLTSYSYQVSKTGPFFLKGKLSLPRLVFGDSAKSSVVVTITNSTGPTTVYTSQPGDDGFYVDTPCTAGDTLTVALSSAAANDNALNAVKCTLAIGSGE